ncbi:hypothetical protein DICSQDRAFT_51896 [Dichomitus squalens LYAD-421 SS1]|uniref:uncharacterized protein n=1 Tax=Dichomitus squalens (strain LYAD-421) TaxID=732165 RepID=UPI0004413549|nr:uncharacterized protein DICSQDRAFT_51896 [Dichomitus squalens LYAD-421 SS1]EJF64501.1 hypothetical protein DICSQDRAFT_51896 [Dichomitus squalens LYAD-421 SS1]
MYPPKDDTSNIYEFSPEELVDKALKTLQNAGIELIEWSSLLHRRMNVPVIIKNFSYLVPDDKLDAASKLLADGEGLPRSQPPPLLIRTGGDFYKKARMYRVTRYTSLALAQHLILYPASFASYAHSDLSPAPRMTSLTEPLCHTVLVPSRPAVYASILRTMKLYPRFDPVRITLQSDLSQLIDYDLYGLDCGYVDIDDDELCEELEVDRRVEDAMCLVEQWRRADALRDQEGWVGDALFKVVSGLWSVEDLPWSRPRGS